MDCGANMTFYKNVTFYDKITLSQLLFLLWSNILYIYVCCGELIFFFFVTNDVFGRTLLWQNCSYNAEMMIILWQKHCDHRYFICDEWSNFFSLQTYNDKIRVRIVINFFRLNNFLTTKFEFLLQNRLKP